MSTVTDLSLRDWTGLLREHGTLEPGTYRIVDNMRWPEIRKVRDGPVSFRAPKGRLWHRVRCAYQLVGFEGDPADHVHTWWMRDPDALPVERVQAWCGMSASSRADEDLTVQYSDERPKPSKACRFCWPPPGEEAHDG